MNQANAVLEAWWAEHPLLTTFGLAFAVVFLLVALLVTAILVSPTMRILYRATRRVIWIKIGTTRHGPPLPKRYREHLDSKKQRPLLIATEGAAFGRTGVIYLTDDEIGFASVRFGLLTEKNVPFAQVTAARISKGSLFDSIGVTTRERTEILRLYRSDRDVGQEFFNHLQMRLGAMRFDKA